MVVRRPFEGRTEVPRRSNAARGWAASWTTQAFAHYAHQHDGQQD